MVGLLEKAGLDFKRWTKKKTKTEIIQIVFLFVCLASLKAGHRWTMCCLLLLDGLFFLSFSFFNFWMFLFFWVACLLRIALFISTWLSSTLLCVILVRDEIKQHNKL